MRIGEFARLSGVPAPRLRRYERLGVLAPAARDRHGYRRYAVEQLAAATHLHALVEAGLPVAVSGALVAALDDPDLPAVPRERRRAAVAAYAEAVRVEPTGGLLDMVTPPDGAKSGSRSRGARATRG